MTIGKFCMWVSGMCFAFGVDYTFDGKGGLAVMEFSLALANAVAGVIADGS